MNTIYRLIVLTALLPLFGCTHLDGDIGDWFGSWHLESIEINGEPDQNYQGNVMISFQGNVFDFAIMEVDEIYGSWSYSGETLLLDASYNAGSTADYLFNPFPVVLRFPPGEKYMEITVTNLTSRVMQWQIVNAQGQLMTYNFRKYP